MFSYYVTSSRQLVKFGYFSTCEGLTGNVGSASVDRQIVN